MPIADKNSATLAKANPRIITARRCLRESCVRSSIVWLGRQLLFSFSGQAVDLHPLLVLRLLPLRFQQTPLFEPVQCGIKRSGFDLQHISRACSNRLTDAVAVLRTPTDRL